MERKKILAFSLIIITLFSMFCNSFSVFADECSHDFDIYANDDETHQYVCVICHYSYSDSCTYVLDETDGLYYCSTCGAIPPYCIHKLTTTPTYDNRHIELCTVCGYESISNCIYVADDYGNLICYTCGAQKPSCEHDFDYTPLDNLTHRATCTTCGWANTVNCYYLTDEQGEQYCYYCGAMKPDCIHEIKYVPNNDGTHQRQCHKCGANQTLECTYRTNGYEQEVCVDCGYIKIKEQINYFSYVSVIPWSSIWISNGTTSTEMFWTNTFNHFPNSYTISQQYPTSQILGRIDLEKVSSNVYDTHANSGYYMTHNLQERLSIGNSVLYRWTAFDYVDRLSRPETSYPYIRLGSGSRVSENVIMRTVVASISYVVYTPVVDEYGVPSTRIEVVTFAVNEIKTYTGENNVYLALDFEKAINDNFEKQGFDTQFSYVGDEFIVNSMEATCQITYNKITNYSGKEFSLIYNDFYQLPLNVSIISWYEKSITRGEDYILVDVDTSYTDRSWFDGILTGVEGIISTKIIGDISIGHIMTVCVSVGLLFLFLKLFTG